MQITVHVSIVVHSVKSGHIHTVYMYTELHIVCIYVTINVFSISYLMWIIALMVANTKSVKKAFSITAITFIQVAAMLSMMDSMYADSINRIMLFIHNVQGTVSVLCESLWLASQVLEL